MIPRRLRSHYPTQAELSPKHWAALLEKLFRKARHPNLVMRYTARNRLMNLNVDLPDDIKAQETVDKIQQQREWGRRAATQAYWRRFRNQQRQR